MATKRSNRRELSVPERHQLTIARRTLNLSDVGAMVLGGPTKSEAVEIIARLTGKRPRLDYDLNGHDARNDSWLLSNAASSAQGEIPFYKDTDGRLTRLTDGTFLDAAKDGTFRQVSEHEAKERAIALNRLAS